MALSVLLVCCSEVAATKDTVHRVQPRAIVRVFDEPNLLNAGDHFDLIIVRAADNAGSARVRQARRLHPNSCVIATADRERSAAAYMSGANEFVMSNDMDRLAHIIGELDNVAPAVSPGDADPIAIPSTH